MREENRKPLVLKLKVAPERSCLQVEEDMRRIIEDKFPGRSSHFILLAKGEKEAFVYTLSEVQETVQAARGLSAILDATMNKEQTLGWIDTFFGIWKLDKNAVYCGKAINLIMEETEKKAVAKMHVVKAIGVEGVENLQLRGKDIRVEFLDETNVEVVLLSIVGGTTVDKTFNGTDSIATVSEAYEYFLAEDKSIKDKILEIINWRGGSEAIKTYMDIIAKEGVETQNKMNKFAAIQDIHGYLRGSLDGDVGYGRIAYEGIVQGIIDEVIKYEVAFKAIPSSMEETCGICSKSFSTRDHDKCTVTIYINGELSQDFRICKTCHIDRIGEIPKIETGE